MQLILNSFSVFSCAFNSDFMSDSNLTFHLNFASFLVLSTTVFTVSLVLDLSSSLLSSTYSLLLRVLYLYDYLLGFGITEPVDAWVDIGFRLETRT